MQIAGQIHSRNKTVYWSFIAAIVTGLYLTSRVNYLLFHNTVEFFSIAVAFSLFMITWNSKQYIKNQYLLVIGISYLFVGILDMVHTMAFKGMPVFRIDGYYAPQLWIASRYLESITLLAAFVFLQSNRKVAANKLLVFYLALTTLLLASILYWEVFPACLVIGKGLTPFKIYSEYIISAILGAAILLLIRNKNHFTPSVYKLLLLSTVYSTIAGLCFVFYIDMYSFSNLVGHYFKLFSFMMIYDAVIATGIEDPYFFIFNELRVTNKALEEEIKLRQLAEIEREGVIKSLEQALDEIKVLKGILPICSYCKKIRDDSGYWSQLEIYIRDHSDMDFSHGVCPDCMKEQLAGIEYGRVKESTKPLRPWPLTHEWS
ncbi:MAG: MASE3 domain-containing protein [Desulfuromonadaceae bacterium]|nr:MASE3 domain-containing protein [Desulfuromonadaceae bacterium]MDD5106447.1 MASE3 domain-containing protein [Desulfuromonadaceae bacterium]